MITAKIQCLNKIDQVSGTEHVNSTVTFGPNYADGRNAEWAAATPNLSLSLVVRGDVADRFESGKCYTLTFEPDDTPDAE